MIQHENLSCSLSLTATDEAFSCVVAVSFCAGSCVFELATCFPAGCCWESCDPCTCEGAGTVGFCACWFCCCCCCCCCCCWSHNQHMTCFSPQYYLTIIIIPQAWMDSESIAHVARRLIYITNEAVGRVGYYQLISGKFEKNNCFSKFSSNSLDFFGWNLLKSWHFLYWRCRETIFSDLQNFSTRNSPVFPYLVKLNDNGSYDGLREPIRKLKNHYPELKIY